MTEKTMSFEEIDKHIEGLNLEDYRAGGRHHVTAGMASAQPQNVLQNVCPLYRGIRPILVAIGNFPIIPKKWRDAINTFVALMDALCPAS